MLAVSEAAQVLHAKAATAADAHPRAGFADIFWPRPRPASQALLAQPGLTLTYNGRGALLRACTDIATRGKRNILLPAYHCPSGITPAIHAGLTPIFYRIRRDLSIDLDDLNAKIDGNTAALLVIHFFGVATDLRPLQALRARGIELIEDWSHSFLQGTPARLSGADSDYRIYSFWKLAPSVVGGGLWHSPPLQENRQPLPAAPLREGLVRLKRMLEEALNHSDHRLVKALFTRLENWRLARMRASAPSFSAEPASEEASPPGESHYPFDLALAQSRMPGIARRILEATDFNCLQQQRRANFNQYGRLLKSSETLQVLHAEMPADGCPWVFPVLLQQRDGTDYRWRAEGVALHTFGIYLHSALFHDTDAATIADALYLSTHLLCLAVHQDLDAAQIERSAATINQSINISRKPA